MIDPTRITAALRRCFRRKSGDAVHAIGLVDMRVGENIRVPSKRILKIVRRSDLRGPPETGKFQSRQFSQRANFVGVPIFPAFRAPETRETPEYHGSDRLLRVRIVHVGVRVTPHATPLSSSLPESLSNLASHANPAGTNAASVQTEIDPRLYWEDLSVGDRWWSNWREISGDDVHDFAALTGDEDPLHTGGDQSPFGRPVAHGLLGLSVMAGLSSIEPPVATLALVELSGWKFEAPIFFGDRVRVLTQVESIRPHGRRAGRIVWYRELRNQDDRVVQSGRIVSLVASNSRNRPVPR